MKKGGQVIYCLYKNNKAINLNNKNLPFPPIGRNLKLCTVNRDKEKRIYERCNYEAPIMYKYYDSFSYSSAIMYNYSEGGWDIHDPDTQKQEVGALLSVMDELGLERSTIHGWMKICPISASKSYRSGSGYWSNKIRLNL